MKALTALVFITLICSCRPESKTRTLPQATEAEAAIVDTIELESHTAEETCTEASFEDICLNLAMERSAPESEVLYSLTELSEGEPEQFKFRTCLISLIEPGEQSSKEAMMGSYRIYNDKDCTVEGTLSRGNIISAESGEIPEMDQI